MALAGDRGVARLALVPLGDGRGAVVDPDDVPLDLAGRAAGEPEADGDVELRRAARGSRSPAAGGRSRPAPPAGSRNASPSSGGSPLTLPSTVATSTGSSARGSTATEPVPGTLKIPPTPSARSASPSMSSLPERYSRPALCSPLTRRTKRSRLVRRTTSAGRLSSASGTNVMVAVGEGQGVPLEHRPAALQVEPDDALEPRDALGDRELVQAGQDPRDRRRPDLVAGDQLEQVGVGRLGDDPHQLLGVDLGEEPRRLVGVGGAQDGQVGGHAPHATCSSG